MLKKIAVYPGTFDPITQGHVDIVERATQLFDELIIAVAASKRKTPFFSLDDRLQLCREVFADQKNIQVKSFSDSTIVDFAEKNNARFLVKGLRCMSDFDYEWQMAGMNKAMKPKIETVFLFSNPDQAFVSGTMVREIISLGGDVSSFVPQAVDQLIKKMKH